jgi:hypothetical protein
MGASMSRLCDCFVRSSYQEIGGDEWERDDKPELHSSSSDPVEKGKKGTNGLANGNGNAGNSNGTNIGNGNGAHSSSSSNGSHSRRGSSNSVSSNVTHSSNGSTDKKTEAIEIRNPNPNGSGHCMNSLIGNQEMTKTIFFAKYDLRDEIGVGSTSKCYKCVRRSDNK